MSVADGVSQLCTIAYFSMEIGFEPAIPTYSGGLGILAGDTLRTAADLGLRMVGVTLLYRRGYFRQHLDTLGNQSETPCDWNPADRLEALPARVAVSIEGRSVAICAWRYVIVGVDGDEVPVYLLDTDLPENAPEDRALSEHLYGGDGRYRLCQEAVLGLGGLAMLRALGHDVDVYHMNEGHSSLLTLALLEQRTREWGTGEPTDDDREWVRRRCVFTTHTPVPAGHDQFGLDLVRQVLGHERAAKLERLGCCPWGMLNMTDLALRLSHYTNGVALRHGQVSRGMFPTFPISSITNGVHAATWIAAPMARLFDRHLPPWRRDNFYLHYAVGIPLAEIRQAHDEAKRDLLAEIRHRTDAPLDPDTFTIGFARRATGYKRPHLLFTDPQRLRQLARQFGPLQVVYAGKAHPRDEAGKAAIRRVFEAACELRDEVRVVYLEDYDMALAGKLCAGVDLWLNTPQKPYEASGTSGMKAALNGVPSLSVLDGWWVEGHVEGVTGWSVGEHAYAESDWAQEAADLYAKLERAVLPAFYQRPWDYALVMRSAIALNGAFFHSQRMLLQYVGNAYAPSHDAWPTAARNGANGHAKKASALRGAKVVARR